MFITQFADYGSWKAMKRNVNVYEAQRREEEEGMMWPGLLSRITANLNADDEYNKRPHSILPYWLNTVAKTIFSSINTNRFLFRVLISRRVK